MEEKKNLKWIRHLAIILLIAVALFFINVAWLNANGTTEKVTKTVTASEPKVYVTKTGDKYHSASCGYLHSSSIAMGKYEAQSKGYSACSVCGGTSSGTISVSYKKTVEEKSGPWTTKKVILNIVLVLLSAPTIYWLVYVQIKERKEEPKYKVK